MDHRDYHSGYSSKIFMPRFAVLIPVLAVVLFSTWHSVHAQTTTVEVAIQSVRPEAKEITVAYKTNLGDKTITLDVSRKAEITLNGDESSLEGLAAGQKATIEYNRELEIITKLAATGEATSPPELIKVTELEGSYSWLSEDGLTVYWEVENSTIWTARRDSSKSYFTDKKELFPGRHPTVSADGLELIFLTGPSFKEQTLHVTTRTSPDASFTRAKELVELRNEPSPKNPCLSFDDLTLFFNRSTGNGSEIAYTTRSDRSSPWSPTKLLSVSFRGEGFLTWPYLTEDGLTMYCSHEGARQTRSGKGNQMVWSRDSTESPFSKCGYIEIDGLPELTGRCPRYVAETGELFFLHMTMMGGEKQSHISVIKN